MDATDWVSLGLLGDQIAQQWYVMLHPGTAIPVPTNASVNIPGVQASFNTNLLIIAAVVVAVVVLSK